MRCPAAPLAGTVSNGEPMSLSSARGGICIDVAWDAAPTDDPADAIGRYTSSLALPLLDEQRATHFAVEHGLCSHLTSLVLVDEKGRALDGLSEMRKVPLAASRMANRVPNNWMLQPHRSLFSAEPRGRALFQRMLLAPICESDAPTRVRRLHARDRRPAWEIDWDRLANALLAGDLSGLTKAQRQAPRRLARSKPIVDLATAMNVDTLSIAVALLAETTQNRMAQRLGRRMLKDAPVPLLTAARWRAEKVLAARG